MPRISKKKKNAPPPSCFRSWIGYFIELFFIVLGSFIAAGAIEFFLVPNNLIDGGTIGISMILAGLTSSYFLPYFIIFLTIPFVVIAYTSIGKQFVLRMSASLSCFAFALYLLHGIPAFRGDILEIVVFGGVMLGAGTGLVLRKGGCLDGTEIISLIIHRKTGFTVGQVILFCNIFIFAGAGIAFGDWNAALRSLMVYMVAYKIIDLVIVGFDETKSVMIISTHSKEISKAIMHEMGIGLTVMYGRGGYSGDAREILYVIIERLQIVELKTIVHREDPNAFIAIENLHEIVHGKPQGSHA